MAVNNNLKKPVVENKAGFPIPERNYKMILLGFAIVVLGFVLMMGGGAKIPISSIMRFSVSGESPWHRLLCWPVSVL